MPYPQRWADRLFEVMGNTYGAEWDRLWVGREMADIKSAWCDALDGFETRPEAIVWALNNLPEKPPSVPTFRALLRQAPSLVEKPLALPEPSANPARIASILGDARAAAAHKSLTGSPAQQVLAGICERLEAKCSTPSKAQRDFVRVCVRKLIPSDPLRSRLKRCGFDVEAEAAA